MMTMFFSHRENRRSAQTVGMAVCAALAMGVGHVFAAEPSGDGSVLDEISITASRIRASGVDNPTPTTVFDTQLLEARTAVKISDALFDMPSMAPTSAPPAFAASAGANYANLRNLNPGSPVPTAARTLVLIDGQRVVANTNTGLIDLNVIPTALVDRVDIVTGGASAAWGSDAVAGVTNFILKKRMEGGDVSVQYGLSQEGDFDEKTVTAAWGTGFAGGRGQFMVAGEYSNLDDIPRLMDRSWGRVGYGSTTGMVDGQRVQRILSPGVINSRATAGGVVLMPNGAIPAASNPLSGLQFGPGGTLMPFEIGENANNFVMIGGGPGINLSQYAVLGTEVQRTLGYARTTFDFTDSVNGHVDIAYADSRANVGSQVPYTPNGDPVIVINADNAFLPAGMASLLADNGLTSFGLGRYTPELVDGYVWGGSASTMKRIALGLNGQFGNGWEWEVHAGSGASDYYDRYAGNTNLPNFRAALDSVVGPGGNPICRVNSTDPADIAITSSPGYLGYGAASGCVPANPFGPGSLTPEVREYATGTSWTTATMKQQTAGLNTQGTLFAMPAGDVSFAAGLEYRKESVSQDADMYSQQKTQSFRAGSWQFGNRAPLDGSYNIKEAFVETILPLLKDRPGANHLEANLAARLADYSTSGNVMSWKVGLNYEPVAGFRLRATQSRDIRAANLLELYTQNTTATATVNDWENGGTPSSVQTITGGSPTLSPEKADTTTIGVVWQPAAVPGLQLTVDGYKIDLADAIGGLSAAQIVDGCYGHGVFEQPQPSLCTLIGRTSSGAISTVQSRLINLSYINTRGVDFELGYGLDANRLLSSLPGRLNFRLLGTYIDLWDVNNGIVTVDRVGQVNSAHWRMTGNILYATGPFSAFLQARYIDGAKLNVEWGPADIYDNTIPSVMYLDGSLRYAFDDGALAGLQVFGSINNLLNKAPLRAPSENGASTQLASNALYDVRGRYFTVGLRYRF